MNLKRGAFIGKVNSLLQEFYYAAPCVLVKLVSSYCCNIYGSNVWDLFSEDSQRLYKSYNVALRTIFNLPRKTHKYLLESLTDVPHLHVQLLSRYVTFAQSLLKNNSFEVRFLSRICFNDMRTILGRSMRKIAALCNQPNSLEQLNANMVKKKIKYAEISPTEEWRIGVMDNMRMMINGEISNCGLNTEEIAEILEFACTS